MTIVMTEKHQITIPKRIAEALGLHKGSLFDVDVSDNKIELVPLEVVPKSFTREQYQKLAILSKKERGLEKRATKNFIQDLKKSKV